MVDLTVFFADLSSFTELTHKLGAVRTHEVVDAFLRMARDVLVAHGAFIDKFVGDAVMALFNVPLRQADHARQAVDAASELRSRLAGLNERFGLELQATVGIASGWARVGRLGSEDSKDYTAIGDVVNLAARLQGKANAGETIISHDSYEKIAADFPDLRGEIFTVKGFREPVIAYRLHATTDTSPTRETPELEPGAAMGLGGVIFATLGAPCAVTTLISPLAVALGTGTLFGLSGVLAFLDQGWVRIPVLVFATLVAAANFYTLWRAHTIHSQLSPVARLGGRTTLEGRLSYLVLGSAIASLALVLFELIAHQILHAGLP